MKNIPGIIGSTSLFLVTAASAMADVGTPIGLQPPAGSVNNVPVQNIPQFAITLLFVIGILIAIGFLIYGGIKWILSGGDKAGVEGARNHIVAAIIGLVIIVLAFAIISVVFTLLGGNFDLKNLCIPNLAGGGRC